MSILNHFKKEYDSNFQNINLNKPYYLDDTYIDFDYSMEDFKNFTQCNDISFINSKLQELDEIRNNLIWSNKVPNDNISICTTGLNLSIELCEYCINNGYAENELIRKLTKYYYIDFKEKIEHWTIFNSFQEAKILQTNGFIEESLALYINILNTHIPLGSVYYDEPFYLAIQILDNKTAYTIYNILSNNFIKTNDKTLGTTLESFKKIISTLNCDENMYSKFKSNILSIIKNNPNIIQTELYKNFNNDFKENIRFIIYNLEKSNTIKREKKGRSYTICINDKNNQDEL